MKKNPPLFLVNGCLASIVMYYVLDLSPSERTVIDWTVIGLVACAILYNLVQLGRRLHGAGGIDALWHLLRTILFWVIGLFNTVLIEPDEIGPWESRLGWAFIAIAVLDTIALFQKERRSVAEECSASSA